jgi:CBS domain-containing protein
MVFEMTDDYGYVVPLMIVAVIAYVTAKRFAPHGLYDGWLAARGEHLAHGVDRSIMDGLHVHEVMDRSAVTVAPDMRLRELIAVSRRTRQLVLPVVEPSRQLVGMITHHTLREAIVSRGDLAEVLMAEDLAEPTEGVTYQQSLREALSIMNARGLDALPVITAHGEGARFEGVITRVDILQTYEQVVSQTV